MALGVFLVFAERVDLFLQFFAFVLGSSQAVVLDGRELFGLVFLADGELCTRVLNVAQEHSCQILVLRVESCQFLVLVLRKM